MGINLIIWIMIGLGAGFMVYMVFDRDKKYLVGTLLSGIVGAFVGGMAYFAIRIGSLAVDLQPVGIFWAIVGALGLLSLITILVKSEDPGELTHV